MSMENYKSGFSGMSLDCASCIKWWILLPDRWLWVMVLILLRAWKEPATRYLVICVSGWGKAR